MLLSNVCAYSKAMDKTGEYSKIFSKNRLICLVRIEFSYSTFGIPRPEAYLFLVNRSPLSETPANTCRQMNESRECVCLYLICLLLGNSEYSIGYQSRVHNRNPKVKQSVYTVYRVNMVNMYSLKQQHVCHKALRIWHSNTYPYYIYYQYSESTKRYDH